MKRLTFATLLLLSWILCAQSFGQAHCIPLDESRWLHEQALKAVTLDSIVHSQGKQIEILRTINTEQYQDFQKLLSIEREKFATQKEITADFVRLADSWREEAEFYQKRYKKQRRQKGVLTIGAVGLLVLMILK